MSLVESAIGQAYNPLVIGHRGAMGYEVENTIPSIQKALEMKVDMIEIDVYKIASGELIVFHDDSIDRLSDSTGMIEQFTLEELKKITLIEGGKIPLLKDVLNAINGQCSLNIELKGANTATDTYRIVQDYIALKGWKKSDFIISSFKWDELEKMRALDEKMPIAVLIGSDPLKAIPMAKKLKAVAINPSFQSLNEDNVKQIKAENFKIYPWTVNEVVDIQKMIAFKVDGIITNYPDRVQDALKSN